MKIGLFKAPIGGILVLEMLTFVEPLGLICMAGGLESAGHEVRVFDLRIDGEEPGLTRRRAFAPDLVGLQCNFTTERFGALRLARRIRREVNTHDWEMHDIIHAVVPTELPLEEFYEENSKLWRHVIAERYLHKGRVKTYVQLGAALATGKVTLGAVRKGMNLAKVFSRPETFLEAHAAPGTARAPRSVRAEHLGEQIARDQASILRRRAHVIDRPDVLGERGARGGDRRGVEPLP